VLNGNPKIKIKIKIKILFWLLNACFTCSKKSLNKMPKCLFSSKNVIPTYLSKKPKPTKRSQQKNKPIKCSHVEKNDSKLLEEKLKHLFLPLQYNWLFKWFFFHWSIHSKISHIYTSQNSILSIWLFKIASPFGDALTLT